MYLYNTMSPRVKITFKGTVYDRQKISKEKGQVTEDSGKEKS